MSNALDVVAVGAAGVASAALAMRSYMLKPAFSSWCTAPARVWFCLFGLSVACAITALSILRGGGHATGREALLLIALAIAACVMLDNLHQQAPGGHETTRPLPAPPAGPPPPSDDD